ncbi:neuropeptide receptor 15 [Biomphalaria glabrata]|nr:neuropeptide receptor 15 [Biomphalaria glabrata]
MDMSKQMNLSLSNTESHLNGHGSVVVDFIPPDILMTGGERRLMEIVIDISFNFIISFTGIFTNVIVITVFTKQGFKDSVNISMTTIAAWDLVKSLGGAMQRMSGPIGLWSPSAAQSWSNICLVIFNYLVSFATYVTSVLAAYVAVERCLCVMMPLKVKWLLTPTVSFVICGMVSFVVFGCFAVIFGIYDIVWVWDSRYNASIAIYQYNEFSTVHSVALFAYYNLSGTLWPLISLVIIVISAVIISAKLREASKFRSQHHTGGTAKPTKHDNSGSDKAKKTKPITNRDQKVVKMLLVIIVLYIVNLSPRVAHYLAKYFIQEYYYLRQYHNLASAMAYIVFFFDYLNGTVGLFVFLSMSSSFRATYKQTFPLCTFHFKK